MTIIALTVAVALAGPGRYALDPCLGVSLPLLPVLVAGLLVALVVAAVAARPVLSRGQLCSKEAGEGAG